MSQITSKSRRSAPLKTALLALLLLIVVGAHIAMWTSDMPQQLALKLTLLNAAAWAVVLLPAWAVGKWAAAHQTRSDDT